MGPAINHNSIVLRLAKQHTDSIQEDPMDDQLTELARDLRERALTYSFLARVFSDEDLPMEFFTALAAEPPQTGTDLDAWASSLANTDAAALEQVRTDVVADHAATLLGMSAAPVSPYESVYTSDGELMMQEARDRAVEAYRASGFGVTEACRVPEDHISTELAFMAGLGDRAANAIDSVLSGANADEEGNDLLREAEQAMNAQISFLETSLLPWVGVFCDKLETRAQTPLYRGAAQMLREFMVQERAYVDELNAAAEQ